MISSRYVLALTLISTFSTFAKLSYQEGKQSINGCQAKVKAAKAQIDKIDQEIDLLKAKLEKASGNADYANDITRINDERRNKIEARNGLIKQHEEAQANLHKEISRVGRKLPIASHGGEYQVLEQEATPKVVSAQRPVGRGYQVQQAKGYQAYPHAAAAEYQAH